MAKKVLCCQCGQPTSTLDAILEYEDTDPQENEYICKYCRYAEDDGFDLAEHGGFENLDIDDIDP